MQRVSSSSQPSQPLRHDPIEPLFAHRVQVPNLAENGQLRTCFEALQIEHAGPCATGHARNLGRRDRGQVEKIGQRPPAQLAKALVEECLPDQRNAAPGLQQ